MATITTYGPGGFDPTKPNNNITGTTTVDDDPLQINGDALRAKAAQAIATNVTYLAIVAPTNAQVVTQVARLTRETTAVIRLLLGHLDDTTGT